MFSSASDKQSYVKRVGSHATKGSARGDAGFTIEPRPNLNKAERGAYGRAFKERGRLIAIIREATASGHRETRIEAQRALRALDKGMKNFAQSRCAE